MLNLLAEQLGRELCQQFVIPEMVSLAEDPNFRVRKATALNFQNICKVGGEHELFERLMPAFVRLSKDDMYRVRRACGESLAKISQFVNDDIRSGVLVEIFLRLAQDMSKLVKQSVLQQSGMFLATLPPKMINDVVLGHFGSLATGVIGDPAADAELRHHCAHTFPAVLQTLGAERWPEVRETYHKLVQCQILNVRVTLALSLHEIAKILGHGRAEEELLSVFEEMVQDVEAVRLGVLRHLADFLRLLSQPCRISYLPLLNDILHTTNQFNWRLRQTLATQLPDLMDLPPPHNVYNTLFPLAMTLVQDPVAHVRLVTFKGVAKMIIVLQGHAVSDTDAGEMDLDDGLTRGEGITSGGGTGTPRILTAPSRLQQGEQYVSAVARAVNALTFGDTFQQRQLWVELSHHLLRDLPQELFETFFVEGLVRLTSDPVLNVRVAVAMVFGGWAPQDIAPWESPSPTQRPSPWTYLMNRQDVRLCVARLAQDDRDVYNWVKNLQPIFPNLEFKSISCRGKKSAPGGSVPVSTSAASLEDMAAIQTVLPSPPNNISPIESARVVDDSVAMSQAYGEEVGSNSIVGGAHEDSLPQSSGLGHDLQVHNESFESMEVKHVPLPAPGVAVPATCQEAAVEMTDNSTVVEGNYSTDVSFSSAATPVEGEIRDDQDEPWGGFESVSAADDMVVDES